MNTNDFERVLMTREQLAARVKELGEQITRDYAGKDLYVVCVLKGAIPFCADLIRSIDLPIYLDCLCVSSYGSGTVTKGEVEFRLDLAGEVVGKDVLIVEDILDTGLTLSKVMSRLAKRGARSMAICALMDKPERRTVPIEAKYVGFTIPDAFVVGYGLDYDQHYRNLDQVYVLAPHVYEK